MAFALGSALFSGKSEGVKCRVLFTDEAYSHLDNSKKTMVYPKAWGINTIILDFRHVFYPTMWFIMNTDTVYCFYIV